METIETMQSEILQMVPAIQQRLEAVQEDLKLFDQAIPIRKRAITTPENLRTFEQDIDQLKRGFSELQRRFNVLPKTLQQVAEIEPEKPERAPLEDALLEAAMSCAQGQEKKIGTTGRGIGPCYADKATRATAVRMIDLCDADRFAQKLEHIVTLKNAKLGALAQLADEPFTPIDATPLAEQYAGYMDILRPHVCDTAALLNDAMAGGRRILFEGANAMLLDVDHGTYPYVTSSSCSHRSNTSSGRPRWER